MEKDSKQLLNKRIDEIADEIRQGKNDIVHVAGMEFHVVRISFENLPAEIEKAKVEIEQINSLGDSAGDSLLKRRIFLRLVVECMTNHSKKVSSNAHQKVGAMPSVERHLIELDDECQNVEGQ